MDRHLAAISGALMDAGTIKVNDADYAQGIRDLITQRDQLQARLTALEAALAPIIAQLRHAYHNLIGPDGPWDREQRMKFADGLIGRQIEKLEQVAARTAAREGR